MKKLPDKIRRVGLVANPDKVNCRPAVQKAAALITEAGRLVLSDKPTADLAGLKAAGSQDTRQLTRQADLIVQQVLFLAVVPVQRRAHAEQQHVPWIEADVDLSKVLQRSEKQARADE